ncbi:MAG: hypothetical protein ACLUVC_03320 [Longibaculum sp.]
MKRRYNQSIKISCFVFITIALSLSPVASLEEKPYFELTFYNDFYDIEKQINEKYSLLDFIELIKDDICENQKTNQEIKTNAIWITGGFGLVLILGLVAYLFSICKRSD